MKDAVDELVDNLNDQITNLEQFERLLARQRDLIIRNDIGPLKDNLNVQNRLIFEAKGLEDRRQAIVDNCKHLFGVNYKESTLKEICEKVELPRSEQLRSIRDALLQAVKKVDRLRKQNEMLINKSLEIIDGTMKIYCRSDDRGKPSYNSEGNRPETDRPSRLVLNRVV